MVESIAADILVIRNPIAGRRREHFFQGVIAELRKCGAKVDILDTTHPGHATELALGSQQRAGGVPPYDIIVAAGGDGTINEVTNGLYGSRVALAVLPMGTANVLANELGLPFRPRKLAQVILAAKTRDIWLGQMDGQRYFSLMLSAGFDARVACSVQPRIKRLLGKGAYALATIKAIFSYKTAGFDLEVDGVPYAAQSVIVTKSYFYGGRFVCAPRASIFDRSLYVCVFTRGGAWHLARYIAAIMLRRLDRLSDVLLIRAERVSISGDASERVQADGDVCAGLPKSITISEMPVRVIVS